MKQKIIKVWVDEQAVYIQTDSGRVYSELFDDYPILRNATPTQRADFECDNFGIRWELLNEDLSYEGFMREKMPKPYPQRGFKKTTLGVSA